MIIFVIVFLPHTVSNSFSSGRKAAGQEETLLQTKHTSTKCPVSYRCLSSSRSNLISVETCSVFQFDSDDELQSNCEKPDGFIFVLWFFNSQKIRVA